MAHLRMRRRVESTLDGSCGASILRNKKLNPRHDARGFGGNYRKWLVANTTSYQTRQADQAATEESHSAGLRYRARFRESRLRTAVRARSGAEVNCEACERAWCDAVGSDRKGQCVSAHYPGPTPLDV